MKALQLGAFSCLIIFSSHGSPVGKWLLQKLCISLSDHENMRKDPPLTLEDLIEKNKDRIKAQLLDPNTSTREPLPLAICNKPALFDLVTASSHADLVEATLQNPNFDITQLMEETTKSTIFHHCAFAGTHDILKLLLHFCKERNIDYSSLLNRKNNYGMTAVATATWQGRSKCLSLLLKAGAETTGSSEQLMYLAAGSMCRGQTKRNTIIQRLLEHNPNLLWQVSPHGKSVETVAADNGFNITADRIRTYKRGTLWHLYNDIKLRFKHLPEEIFNHIVNQCIDA